MAKYWERQELGGDFKYFWNFHPENWGRFAPIFDYRIFYRWVVQPPTRESCQFYLFQMERWNVWPGRVSNHPITWIFSRFQLRLRANWNLGSGGLQNGRTLEENRWFYKTSRWNAHSIRFFEAVEVTLLVDLTPEHLKSASEVLAFSEADSLAMLRLKFRHTTLRWMMGRWEEPVENMDWQTLTFVRCTRWNGILVLSLLIFARKLEVTIRSKFHPLR